MASQKKVEPKSAASVGAILRSVVEAELRMVDWMDGITFSEFQSLIKGFTEEEIANAFKVVDTDADGLLSYADLQIKSKKEECPDLVGIMDLPIDACRTKSEINDFGGEEEDTFSEF